MFMTKIVAQAGVAFKFSDQVTLNLTQQFEDVDSDVSESFTRNATRGALTVEF